jgi:hypothetical protein
VIVFRVFHYQVLLACKGTNIRLLLVDVNNDLRRKMLTVHVCGYNSSFTFVKSSSCTWPVHFVSRNFIFCKRVVTNFEFSWSAESCHKSHVVCGEEKRKLGINMWTWWIFLIINILKLNYIEKNRQNLYIFYVFLIPFSNSCFNSKYFYYFLNS